MSKLYLTPIQSSYSVEYGNDIERTETQGGRGRYRRVRQGSSHRVNAEWILTPAQCDYFMSFYSGKINGGAGSFEIDLKLDGPAMEEYTAHFIPGSLQTPQINGPIYTTSATLEVLRKPRNSQADIAIADWVEYFEGDICRFDELYEYSNPLEHLANVALPDIGTDI